jgi:hypothetical protein
VLEHLDAVERDYQRSREPKRRWWLGRG